jgi:tetrahydromethanopterin S-methyltransferase subunit B
MDEEERLRRALFAHIEQKTDELWKSIDDLQKALEAVPTAERSGPGWGRDGLGNRAGTCIDPKMQVVQDKSVCVVTCERSPEPVFLKWKRIEATAEGDFFVRSGPGTVRLPPESTKEYIRTRFPAVMPASASQGGG